MEESDSDKSNLDTNNIENESDLDLDNDYIN